jgi:hypothetical protein
MRGDDLGPPDYGQLLVMSNHDKNFRVLCNDSHAAVGLRLRGTAISDVQMPDQQAVSSPYHLTRYQGQDIQRVLVKDLRCTEEKTFNREDYLTRNYQVYHLDIEFPGKHWFLEVFEPTQ